jgi:hypothetical protein
MAEQTTEPTVNCSFCGKSQDEVRKLIAGQNVYICDECVDLCNDIIAEECEREAQEEPGAATPSASDPLVPASKCIVCCLPKDLTDLLLLPNAGFVCCSCAQAIRSVADAHLPPPSDLGLATTDSGSAAGQPGSIEEPCRLCRRALATLDISGRGCICSECADAVARAGRPGDHGAT